MVVLMFKSLDIPEGFNHIASDWQISTDKYFRSDYIVAQSMNDSEHLTSILFNVDLDPDKVYYARARVIMDYGPSDWSDIDLIRTEDLDQIDLDVDIPSVIAKPSIDVNFKIDEVPPVMFKILTSPMSTNSNAKHLSTDYIITDLSGNIMYTKLNETEDLTSHLVSEVMLPENRFYLVKASHTSSSGDSSALGQKLIYVPGNDIIEVTSSLTSDDATTNGLTVQLTPVDNVSNIYVKLYMIGADDPVLSYNETKTGFVFTIPSGAFLNPGSTYLLSIQYEYINGAKTPIKYFKVIAG